MWTSLVSDNPRRTEPQHSRDGRSQDETTALLLVLDVHRVTFRK